VGQERAASAETIGPLAPDAFDRRSHERLKAIRRALDADASEAAAAGLADRGAMTDQEARSTITETLERLGAADTLLGDVDATIARRDDRPSRAMSSLPAIDMSTAAEADPVSAAMIGGADFVAHGVLGKGGMGVVRLAQQRSLGRDVAVKTSGKNDAAAIRALVREARITGGLEHPNVVPVHALGIDREGAPLLVMKRIEGVSWRTLIHDETHDAWGPLLGGHGDRLRAHVEILMQVSRALVFAHDRGVIHRDVKPENVMIGRFGEVYLLDWGVSVRLEERVDEPHGIVGTPAFLAPEMVRGDPLLVGTHTDVYLLGATLCEVLTRRPPHDAPNALAALVLSLMGAPPQFPADVPRELAQLVRKAMALLPGDRVASAELFREELERFLISREAEIVLAEGHAALVRAEKLIESDGADAPDAFRALIEARFAFASTLKARGDEASRHSLDRCLTRLVERELVLRSPKGARALFEEMSAVPPSLVQRVAALEATLAAERDAATDRERARREGDSSRSLSVMVSMVAIMVTLLVVAWSLIVWKNGRPLTTREALEMWAVALFGFGTVAFVGRRQFLTNRATRALGAFLAIAFGTPFASILLAFQFDTEMYQRSAYSWIASAGISLMGEVLILPEIWTVAAVYVMATILVVVRPEWTPIVQPIVYLGNAVLLVRALRLHAKRSRVTKDDEDTA
jgi:hypothetical protein